MEDASRPRADDVILKLKDDGDFDSLRLKIIRKLKDNEDLRNHIVSEIKQSATVNREGVEKLKPRQLSDAIHQEIGNKIMDQISDELWKIIRSKDGMQTEIRETVESVYNRLMNPLPKEENHASASTNPPAGAEKDSAKPVQPAESSICQTASPNELDPDVPPGFAPSEPDVPPGFAPTNQSPISNRKLDTNGGDRNRQDKEVREEPHDLVDTHPSASNEVHPLSPNPCSLGPGGRSNDDEPDVPPGFG